MPHDKPFISHNMVAICLLLSFNPLHSWAAQENFITINEVMPKNNSVIQDLAGDFEDWIELYNSSNDPIDVAGMYLSDDPANPTQWEIPSNRPQLTLLPPQSHLLIWADNEESGEELHANFKLSAQGESILLYSQDGLTLLDQVLFDVTDPDISWGRFPDGAENWAPSSVPTPHQANSSVLAGATAVVEFSFSSGLYTAPVTLTLSTTTPNATIYYSLDDTEPYSASNPRAAGKVYNEPLTITQSTIVRARAVRNDWQPSPVTLCNILCVDDQVQTFSSNLAVAVVDTFEQPIAATTQTSCIAALLQPDDSGLNQLLFTGRAGLNIRGRSSVDEVWKNDWGQSITGFPKKQYHFEIWDEQNQDFDVELLGMPADSDWILQGPYSDKTQMRNALCYQLSNDMGRYTVRTRYIEMFLNQDDTAITMDDYVGIYVLMEKIKRSDDRVDIAKLKPTDTTEPDITGGYILKLDKNESGDQRFNTGLGQLIYDDPTGLELTTAQKNWIQSYIQSFETVLHGESFADPNTGYAHYIDVGSFIDYHLLMEFSKSVDAFRFSTYMFKDRNGKLTMGPAWDFNLSFGNAGPPTYHEGFRDTDSWYSDIRYNSSGYSWYRRLFQDPEFRLVYADRWFSLRKNLFAPDRLHQWIDDTANLLEDAQQRNFDRWPESMGHYVWPNFFIGQSYSEEVEWLKSWISDRVTWMDQQIALEFAPAPPRFVPPGGSLMIGQSIDLADFNGTVYYTVDGTDPRQPGQPAGISDQITLVPFSGDKRVSIPTEPFSAMWRGKDFDDSAWTLVQGSPGGIGYERGSGYETLLSLDVENGMYNQSTSCLLRYPFALTSDPADLDKLILNLRYDDGFVAYLNGQEIERAQVNGLAAWNSTASSHEGDSIESFDISEAAVLLQPGHNVLAIHAINAGKTSSDFLMAAELVAGQQRGGRDASPSPSAIVYQDSIQLNQSTLLKARSFEGESWSALAETLFSVGPIIENLRITEILYHPVDINTEFIELTNIGSEPINLNLVQFTDGIEFTYEDNRHPLTDTHGHSLVIRDPNQYHTAADWQASDSPGGTPGVKGGAKSRRVSD